ncbi:NDMA-dependent alcohol dehydrogenase [Rhodococcoides fascians]|uniref:NDMA-dependent alcohol dehydrogenase n=1 Tax=Rhodococcoides fascians TaxID=1828 RepID=UPI00050CF3AA|nr:NDMA-dependent alcohol dehydrogenase [Rhodococcus fascians]
MTAHVRGAIINEVGGKWVVEDLELAEPGPGEIRIKIMASGLCHSDDHLVTGDIPNTLPLVGGHEGSGIIDAVGVGVTNLKVGDHVATAYLPACGKCAWCAQGMQYICDTGAGMDAGMMLDGTPRFFRASDKQGVGAMQRLGTFANYTVTSEAQAVKIDDDIPFDVACLVSCGVATGWGAAVNGGGVRPGDTTMIVGVGGVGINAVQGAHHAGSAYVVAVDPVEFKREQALKLGATHAFASIAEAMPFIGSKTNGQGADSAVVTVGVVDGQLIADAFAGVRKEGTVAVVSIGQNDPGIPISPLELVVYAKHLRGVLFGNMNPTRDIPALLNYYKAGRLKLDELITRRYTIDQVNEAYADMHAGLNLRGVLVHEH